MKDFEKVKSKIYDKNMTIVVTFVVKTGFYGNINSNYWGYTLQILHKYLSGTQSLQILHNHLSGTHPLILNLKTLRVSDCLISLGIESHIFGPR